MIILKGYRYITSLLIYESVNLYFRKRILLCLLDTQIYSLTHPAGVCL
jgi:hypothetical protein